MYIELESPISQTGCGIQLEIGHDYVFNGILYIHTLTFAFRTIWSRILLVSSQNITNK